jgi:hypothetical protein
MQKNLEVPKSRRIFVLTKTYKMKNIKNTIDIDNYVTGKVSSNKIVYGMFGHNGGGNLVKKTWRLTRHSKGTPKISEDVFKQLRRVGVGYIKKYKNFDIAFSKFAQKYPQHQNYFTIFFDVRSEATERSKYILELDGTFTVKENVAKPIETYTERVSGVKKTAYSKNKGVETKVGTFVDDETIRNIGNSLYNRLGAIKKVDSGEWVEVVEYVGEMQFASTRQAKQYRKKFNHLTIITKNA